MLHDTAMDMRCKRIRRLPEGSAGSRARMSPQNRRPGSDHTSAASVTPPGASCYPYDLLRLAVPYMMRHRCVWVQKRFSHPAVSDALSDRKQLVPDPAVLRAASTLHCA